MPLKVSLKIIAASLSQITAMEASPKSTVKKLEKSR